jgi:hypothetical protein
VFYFVAHFVFLSTKPLASLQREEPPLCLPEDARHYSRPYVCKSLCFLQFSSDESGTEEYFLSKAFDTVAN